MKLPKEFEYYLKKGVIRKFLKENVNFGAPRVTSTATKDI